MILKKRKTKKCGSILVFTLIVMSLILVTALALSTTTIIERKASTITRSSAAAIQGADTGLEHILKEFRHEYAAEETYKDFIAHIGTFTGASDQYCDDVTKEDSGDYIIKVTDPEQILRISARRADTVNPDNTIIVRCDNASYTLQDIVAFKSTGEDRIATRALRIDMGQSIDRGLLALWDFEDYENAFAQTHEEDYTQFAIDMSKNGNTAYLCPDDQQSTSRCNNLVEDALCNSIGDDMNPGPDDSMTDYNDGVSWYGDLSDPPSEEGIADHDLDTNNHWAMEFSLDESGSPSPTEPTEYLLVKDDGLEVLDDDNFSISMWVQPQIAKNQFLLTKGINTANNKRFRLSLEADEDINFFMRSGSKEVDLTFGSAPTNQWTHIVVTVERPGASGATVTGYVKGDNISSASHGTIGDIGNEKDMVIGATNNRKGKFFVGQMDDIRMYNRVLSEDEITELCTQGGYTQAQCS